MCLFDHAIENATSYFTKHNIGKPSYFKWFDFLENQRAKICFDTKISKLFIYENYGGSIVWYDHTVLKTII
jgi:hypothetical protein